MFQWTGSGIKKKTISKRIRADILKVSKDIAKEVDGVLPYDLKINWVKEIDKETFINKNQVIIRMNNNKSKTKNTVYALNQYVEKGLLPKTKKYIDIEIRKALDIAIVRKLLLLINDDGLDYFDENYLEPFIKEEESKYYLERILKLDEAGMLVSVLLKEFVEKGRMIYPQLPDECLQFESKEFLRFLYNIANKSPGEEVPLAMNGEYFKVGVILIAKSETIGKLGYKPYIKRAFDNLDNGLKTIYLLADTYNKSLLANYVAEVVKEKDIRVKSIKSYSYKRKIPKKGFLKGVCIAIHTTKIDYDEEIVV